MTHDACMLLSIDNHIWDKIVAHLSLEDHAAMAVTCWYGHRRSRLLYTVLTLNAHSACLYTMHIWRVFKIGTHLVPGVMHSATQTY